MINEIEKRVRRMLASVRQPFRGVLAGVATDGPVAIVQGEGLAGEAASDMEMFQHYGITSAPPAGAMWIVVPIGGKTSHSIVIATEHGTYRLKNLKPGEVALYTDEGDSVVLGRGRVMTMTTKTLKIDAEDSVEINTKTMKVNASESITNDTPQVDMTHQLNVTEQISGQGGLSVEGGDGVRIRSDVAIEGAASVSQDATIGGKSFIGHRHLETGSITDPPQ
ncbi:phage baseplate protein [Burkholderia cepacia]|uniref:phage baseplate assembly protein V n=1 Tax=Burkholderia cepacia TaxID=292 RepID=UPI00075E3403|nr:phage baseplate assembly protein V [Burkholderia cepacia]KWF84976.1 phage baseplate protein [Burkholderia cepacia]